MSEGPDSGDEGVFIESGSGGFISDLVFHGGQFGLELANQQFTMRNLTFFNTRTAINQIFNWGWLYKGLSINNCSVGIDMTNLVNGNGPQNVGSVVVIDSEINDTPVGIAVSRNSTSTPEAGGTLVLENVQLNNVGVAVQSPSQTTVLAGGSTTIAAWAEGNEYVGTTRSVIRGDFQPNTRPGSLTAGADYYERSKPQYDYVPVTDFVSVRAAGAYGDGVHDDSGVLNTVLADAAAAGKVVFFDAGDYLVKSTVYIPAGSKITGETYPVILSNGAFFNDMTNPQPVVQVGKPGETGTVEWSDMIVSTQGQQEGAILIQWNLDASGDTPAGVWDVHTRIGGFAGSDLQLSQCPKTPGVEITAANFPTQCIAAFLDTHVTESAANIYMENNWHWVADHDVEDPALTQISIYAGRGLLIESTKGGIWLYGTAVEHHTMYEYQLVNTKDVFLGFIQTESPYYQPNPSAPVPFTTDVALSDPVFAPGVDQSSWGFRAVNSEDILVYGAGHYSFFSNYSTACSDQGNGETCQVHIVSIDAASSVSIYGLSTVGTTNMITYAGVDEAPHGDNDNGFVSTIAIFRTS